MGTRTITYAAAINETLRKEMEKDETVFLMGEDIGPLGGLFGVTKGLHERFGSDRVLETPISESGYVGAAVGAAMLGMKPIVELQFMDWCTVAMDAIVNSAAKTIYVHDGQVSLHLVIRAPYGAVVGAGLGCHHSQSFESFFTHVPGLKVAMPTTPYDAAGLLRTSIQDGNPILFLEHKVLYSTKGEIPEEEYLVPFGRAAVRREGSDATIVGTGLMVHKALAAANQLQGDGISCEVIDLRTLLPWDKDLVKSSVKKTGRLVIVHEAWKIGGFGGEVGATVAEEATDYLRGPIVRVGCKFAPIPFSPPLEKFIIPNEADIVAAVKRTSRKAS